MGELSRGLSIPFTISQTLAIALAFYSPLQETTDTSTVEDRGTELGAR